MEQNELKKGKEEEGGKSEKKRRVGREVASREGGGKGGREGEREGGRMNGVTLDDSRRFTETLVCRRTAAQSVSEEN